VAVGPVNVRARRTTGAPKGNSAPNVLELPEVGRAALLLMRAEDPRQGDRNEAPRWILSARVQFDRAALKLGQGSEWVSLLPWEITLDPLETGIALVAIACSPVEVPAWRFDFRVREESPDARAEAWALVVPTTHLRAGFFRLPDGEDFGSALALGTGA